MYNLSYKYDNMLDIAEKLQEIGLSEHEATIFSTLLLHSPSSASFLAKKAGLSRSSVYTVLSALIAKGLVATTYKNEVKQFIAQDYDALKEFLVAEEHQLKNRFEALKNIQSTLTTISHTTTRHVPNISFFEGQEGLKKVYMTMMRTARKDDTLYLLRDEFVWHDDWKFIFEQEWSTRVAKLKQEKNIRTLLLVNQSDIEKKAENLYKTKTGLRYRFLPKKHSVTDFATYIMGDMVAIMSMESNNLVGISITNQNIADNHKQIFNTLWATATTK